MKTLTKQKASTAEAFLAALPHKSETASITAKTMAAVAMAVASLSSVNAVYKKASADIYKKVMAPLSMEKYEEREKALHEAFPDGGFDTAKWNEVCPDPEFEKVLLQANEEYTEAVMALNNDTVEVQLNLTGEHFNEITEVLVTLDSVKVGKADVPMMRYLATLADLFE